MRFLLSFPNINLKGGVERVICESANYLVANGHEVGVLAGQVDDGVLNAKITHHRLPTPHRFNVGLAHYARCFPAAYANIRDQYDAHGAFCTASPAGGVLWVQAVHKRWIEVAKQSRGLAGRLKQRLNPFHRVALRLEKSMIGGRQFAKLIALTNDVAADLQRFYDVPQHDIVVLPNGVNRNEFRVTDASQRAAARIRLGVPQTGKIIVFVANEVDRKGFVPLLLALACIKTSQPHLLAVGRLGSKEHWASTLARLGLENRVTFTGPTADVASAFGAADLFALPTSYEAWGLVIIEALASGLPVLTSRLAGAAEAIREGETGYLLEEPHAVPEIAAKLEFLLAGRHTDAVTISASVERYEWSNILSQYEQVLIDARPATHRR